MALEAGMKAPDIKAPADGGNTIQISDYEGKWLVLYFYPKDDTSGCTKEACNFNDNLSSLKKLGVEVVGISPDSTGSHDKFKEKYGLHFPLLSDPDKSLADTFGVLGEKKMFGKSSMGIIRSTFLIDPEGTVRHVWKKVNVDGHVEEVMNKIQELKGE